MEKARKGNNQEEPFLAIDPVCKITVDENKTNFTREYKGKKYFFCAPGCKKKFDAEPAKYTK